MTPRDQIQFNHLMTMIRDAADRVDGSDQSEYQRDQVAKMAVWIFRAAITLDMPLTEVFEISLNLRVDRGTGWLPALDFPA